MKFNIEPPVAESANFQARVGDVYPAKGGARYKGYPANRVEVT